MNNQINSQITQSAPKLAVTGFMIAAAVGLICGVAIGVAGDTTIGWTTFYVSLLVGAIWSFIIMWKVVNHQVELENKAADVAVTRANTEWERVQVMQLPMPITNYQAPISQQPLALPRRASQLTQISPNKAVLMQAEPVEGDGVNVEGWPEDVPALRVAFALLQAGKPPTRRNFIALGLNSGSRYEAIRAWLVEAGLAQNAGDGNPTPWTNHAYQEGVRRAIEEFLLPTSLSV